MKKFKAMLLALIVTAAMTTGCAAGGNDGNSGTADTTAPAETTSAENTASLETEKTDEETTKAAESENEDEEENYDTGDASLDNIRNQDDIGESELLVISFGTSFNDSRRLTIGAVENDLEAAFPDFSVRRGFTANIVIDHVERRDGVHIDDINEALDRAANNGVKTLVIQPTHLMNGIEYEEIVGNVANYSDAFEKVVFGEPLLTSDDDFKRVEKAITEWTAEYDDGETAVVFMGHGTEHKANGVYPKLQNMLTSDGYSNYFIGTVEASPALDDVLEAVKNGDYKRVILEPLMIVAGDHANNDMAGSDADSWKTAFENEGYEVVCLLRGLGENEEIRHIYIDHAQAAINSITE